MSDVAQLNHHFKALDLPEPAVAWLIDVWRCIQVFDDAADGDAIDPAELNHVIFSSLVGMQLNPFHAQNAAVLLPVLALQIMKWHGANHAERGGRADVKSYMWRAGYYDLALMVVGIVHGPEKAGAMAETVMRLYGDGFADYQTEFAHA